MVRLLGEEETMEQSFEIQNGIEKQGRYWRMAIALALGLALAAPLLLSNKIAPIEKTQPVITGMIVGSDGRKHYFPPSEDDGKSPLDDWIERDRAAGLTFGKTAPSK